MEGSDRTADNAMAMDPPSASWTRHSPTPSENDKSRCAICGRPIATARRASTVVGDVVVRRHVETPSGFDAERQKKLYEQLDVIVAALDTDHVPAPSRATREAARHELLALLETLSSWHGHDELWRTIERWRRDHHE